MQNANILNRERETNEKKKIFNVNCNAIREDEKKATRHTENTEPTKTLIKVKNKGKQLKTKLNEKKNTN